MTEGTDGPINDKKSHIPVTWDAKSAQMKKKGSWESPARERESESIGTH